MKAPPTATKDPICGMTVDEGSALSAKRDGKTYFFCGEPCRKKFLAQPVGSDPKSKGGGCCG